ncbi:alpha/beta hydrolase [uncultured Sphingomonas sp.]|uniref:alpha/beta fold hydrolase n=1 Tax=uncultured Sphingomonas sp. TaxID=158754 RepID=UPI0025F7E3C0|nr:alpha/beta hydrolase [uncultured Sphingomonas sp.]
MSRHAAFRRAIPADACVSTWHAADGWTIRRFDWSAAGKRGSILFQTGRGDVFEKYLEAFAHWHEAGWSVSAFDWRGQGGSGRLSADRNVGHADDFAPWIADLSDFWRSWIAERNGPHVVVGHSMGGFLVLRALVDRVIEADAAVLVAPMLGLRSPVGARIGGWLAALMRRAGNPARAAWKGHEKPGARVDRQSILTADADRYSDEAWWYAQSPELRLGPPSWAWLAEAFAGTQALRRDPALVRMTTPTLMLLAEHDALVDARAAAAIGARLHDATVIRFGAEAAHELLREADPVRDRALAAIDAFLAERTQT